MCQNWITLSPIQQGGRHFMSPSFILKLIKILSQRIVNIALRIILYNNLIRCQPTTSSHQPLIHKNAPKINVALRYTSTEVFANEVFACYMHTYKEYQIEY